MDFSLLVNTLTHPDVRYVGTMNEAMTEMSNSLEDMDIFRTEFEDLIQCKNGWTDTVLFESTFSKVRIFILAWTQEDKITCDVLYTELESLQVSKYTIDLY